MKRSNWKKSVKKVVAGALLGCMLFTMAGVNSGNELSPNFEVVEGVVRL